MVNFNYQLESDGQKEKHHTTWGFSAMLAEESRNTSTAESPVRCTPL
jgi:hypothetical protein